MNTLYPCCRWFFPALAGCLVVTGCAKGPATYSVSGTVLFQGKPLPAGVIFFNPDVVKKNNGPQGYATIKNGAYSTADAGGKGVADGPYVARIEGFDGHPGRERPLGQPLFADFSQAVDLPKTDSVQDFAIKK